MSQKLLANGFKWKKNVSKFDEDVIKIMIKIVIKDIFLKQIFINKHNQKLTSIMENQR